MLLKFYSALDQNFSNIASIEESHKSIIHTIKSFKHKLLVLKFTLKKLFYYRINLVHNMNFICSMP